MASPAPSADTAEPKTSGRLFPAHLAPIDRFLLDDDVPRHPMSYVIQMECDGAFDRAAFETAFGGAVQRHPYTRAKIGPGKRGLLSWIDPKGDHPFVDWGDANEPIVLDGPEGIDITRKVGLRLWVRQDEAASRLVFQWHHSVTDGTGAFRFMGDILALYDQQQGGDRSELLPLDPSLLRERRARMARAYTAGDKAGVRTAVWRQLRDVFTRWAAPLAVPAIKSTKSPDSFPGFELHTFSKEETQALRAAADAAGVMLNDVLMERLFQCLRHWNTKHAKRPSRRPLRIMMPTDLRGSSDTEMPAANMVGYTFVSRPASACENSAALLRDIASETAQIKHAHKGEDFIDAITAAEAFPRVMPWLLHRGWCLATAVLTNNGDPARRMNARLPRKGGLLTAGNVTVTRFSGVPPLREGTNVVVAAMTYGRQLTVNVRCNPNTFGDAESREFLQLYVERMLAWPHDAASR